MIEVEVTPISTRGKRICVVYCILFCMAGTAIAASIAAAVNAVKRSVAVAAANRNRVRGIAAAGMPRTPVAAATRDSESREIPTAVAALTAAAADLAAMAVIVCAGTGAIIADSTRCAAAVSKTTVAVTEKRRLFCRLFIYSKGV